MQCPGCKTEVDDKATGCPTCGARRGYFMDRRGRVGGKLKVWGGIAAVLIVGIGVFIAPMLYTWPINDTIIWLLGIFAFVMLLAAAQFIFYLIRGPVWYPPEGWQG